MGRLARQPSADTPASDTQRLGTPTKGTAATTAGLDFTRHMRLLCEDIVRRLPELHHINLDFVAIRVCQTRSRALYGIHASMTPLRFRDGARTTVRRGRHWTVRPVRDGAGREMLYLLSFYLPRFCDQPCAEKLATIVHELWHIGPRFDGDLRRLAGRCYAHGHSEAAYHRQMRDLAQRWLALNPAADLYAFLSHDFRGLRAQYGAVFGTTIPTPKLILLSSVA
ncbi:MAG TPA: hypothetical protein VGG64_02575 [Pirellulales bacterium]